MLVLTVRKRCYYLGRSLFESFFGLFCTSLIRNHMKISSCRLSRLNPFQYRSEQQETMKLNENLRLEMPLVSYAHTYAAAVLISWIGVEQNKNGPDLNWRTCDNGFPPKNLKENFIVYVPSLEVLLALCFGTSYEGGVCSCFNAREKTIRTASTIVLFLL